MKNKQVSPNHHIAKGIINDINLVDLVRKYNTPLYVYDKKIIENQYEKLKSLNSRIFYSVKANPFNEILQFLNSLGSYFEVVSLGELQRLRESNISLSKALFVGPAKKEEELEYAIKNDIGWIAVESKNELLKIEKISKRLNINVNILLRINPKFNAGAIINMSGITQFGLEKDVAVEILKNTYKNINILGLHFYLGTNILDEKQIIENTKDILNLVDEIEYIVNINFITIDIGGGFGVPYNQNDKTLDINKLSLELNLILEKYSNKNIFVESGRFLVAHSGIFITRVLDIKVNFGIKFILLDGGTNFVGGDNRYRGFRISPIKVLNSKNQNEEIVTLVGSLCTSSDILAKDILLPQIEIEDFLAFYQVGAYNFTASPILFLSHTIPKEVLI